MLLSPNFFPLKFCSYFSSLLPLYVIMKTYKMRPVWLFFHFVGVLILVQRNWNIYIYKYKYINYTGDLLKEIGLCDYGVWEVLRPAVGQLETQENQRVVPAESEALRRARVTVLCQARDGRRASVSVPVQMLERMNVAAQAVRQELPLTRPFCLAQFFTWWHESHPCCRKQSALLSLPIQVLLSPRNTLTDTPRIVFSQMFGHLKVTRKISHHCSNTLPWTSEEFSLSLLFSS